MENPEGSPWAADWRMKGSEGTGGTPKHPQGKCLRCGAFERYPQFRISYHHYC